MTDDTPQVDLERIVYHARKKTLPARVQTKVDVLVTAFQQFKLARAIEAMVQWAYDEGFKDGKKHHRG